ncbi:hypothetical protein SDC9_19796 [bioreactor metagenome]|uniref:Lipoprotein n=1 Tax=bioreactor metagenome TaxID=1076179 RepID=A0A644U4Z0_9ZZZZ
MLKLLQVVFIAIFTIFLFSGCSVYSMQGKVLSLNPDTIQNRLYLHKGTKSDTRLKYSLI